MLRTYGGIIDNPVAISEKQLSWILKKDLVQIKHELTELHQQRVIHYVPQKETPHIRFLQNRVKAEDLYIDAVAYLKRKNAYAERIKAMLGYMQDNSCRAQFIGRYFGDDKIKSCGICDLCLEKKKSALTASEYKIISEALHQILLERSCMATELPELIPGFGKEKIWKVLEDWGAEEKISLNTDGKISLK